MESEIQMCCFFRLSRIDLWISDNPMQVSLFERETEAFPIMSSFIFLFPLGLLRTNICIYKERQ